MDKIKSDVDTSRKLLEETEDLISTQSAILSGELERMHNAIEKDKFNDTGIHKSLSRLQHHIQYLKKSSLQLNSGLSSINISSEPDSLSAYPEKAIDMETDEAESGVMTEGNN